MKTIIIPADQSNNFYNCLNFALMFEQTTPIDILILFENKKFENEYFQKFEEIVLNFQPAFINPESIIRFHITTGKIEDEICVLVNENKNSFFINTFAETNDAKKNGYTIENALKIMKCSAHNVVTLPTGKIPSSIKRIIFPIHHLSKVRHKVTLTAEIAKLFGADIYVLNANVSNQSTVIKQCGLYSRQVVNHFKSIGISSELYETEGKNLVELILSFSNEKSADLIPIIKERNSGGVFGRSYLQDMIINSTIPLLVIGPRKGRISASFKTSG